MSTATDGHRPSGPLQSDDEERISEAVRDIAEQRAHIEQAKGMLMFIYGLDEHAAFDLLRCSLSSTTSSSGCSPNRWSRTSRSSASASRSRIGWITTGCC